MKGRLHSFVTGVIEWFQIPDFDSGYVGSNPTTRAKRMKTWKVGRAVKATDC